MSKKFLFSLLTVITLPALLGVMTLNLVSADTESTLIVHEFEINGNSENFVMGMDEVTVVRGIVENTGAEDTTIELKMNGRYHYERWDIKAGETKDIESSPYEHRGWYEGVFLMSLGDKEIEVTVVKETEDEVLEGLRIESFTINGSDRDLRVKEGEGIEIHAKVTNKTEAPVEISLIVEKDSDARPVAQPWPYVELDIEEVRLLGHRGHYENSCSYGAFNALITPLKERIGHPYTQIPTYMLHFGRGGFMGEKSVCGAMIGAVAAINLITGEEYRPLGEELLKYYKETELPTAVWDEYLEMEDSPIDPEKYIAEPLGGSAAKSVECEKSLQQWYDETGNVQGPKRNERCGRLTGDIAAKAAELLNEWWREREGDVISQAVLAEAGSEFHKKYEIAPGESLEIREVLAEDWKEFESYTVTLSGADIQKSIALIVADEKATERSTLLFAVIMVLIFIAGIVSGKLIKKE